jgi:hypothetical protein
VSHNIAALGLNSTYEREHVTLTQPLWKTVWRLIKKLITDLPYDPAIPLLGIDLKECESSYNKGTCTPMYIAALFTIATLWMQPRCPTTDEWIKEMWNFYTVEFYLATKKNEIFVIRR